MRDGRIQQQGGPTELYERPVNRFVADFIGISNFIDASVVASGGTRGSGHGPDRARPDDARNVTRPRGRTRRPATEVIVAVRPERLEVVAGGRREDAARNGWTVVPGPDQPGHLSRRPDGVPNRDRGVGELSSGARTQRGREWRLGAGPGDPVVVRWHEEANLILVG